jgi:membrane protein implicated in regulation of membrane protease activity
MDASLMWIVVACLFAGAEMLTMGLFLAPFALGAASAALLAGLGAGLDAALASFVAVALLALFAVRPLLLARPVPQRIRTGTAALIGARAMVLEPIVAHHAGSVQIAGEVWSARAYDDEPVAAGAVVDVIEIRGATAWVIE